MTFLALVAALLLEQARALSPANPVQLALDRYAGALERALDTGRSHHGVLAWIIAIVPIVCVVGLLSRYLHGVAGFAGLLFDIVVLYLTFGFRHFSHAYSEALEALRAGDVIRAAASVRPWLTHAEPELGPNEIARLAIERGLLNAHRQVFGVMAWFAIFGPAGAVLYRLAAILHDRWGARIPMDGSDFGQFSRQAFRWIDWVPARLTAVSFAVVGDFEDALYCWRTQARQWPTPAEGLVLASGAGAIGVRIGPAPGGSGIAPVPAEIGTGEEADSEMMTSAVGLVWRALVLWLFVILLVTVANWLG